MATTRSGCPLRCLLENCAVEVVEEVWMEMNEIVKKLFVDYEDVCLRGDGRNDSPGHSPH